MFFAIAGKTTESNAISNNGFTRQLVYNENTGSIFMPQSIDVGAYCFTSVCLLKT